MTRYVVLVNFTEKGIANVKDSSARAEAFRKSVAKAGGTVPAMYWTLGPYDGVVVLEAPDDATAAALVLGLGQGKNVRTTMLRAFDAKEFATVVGELPA